MSQTTKQHILAYIENGLRNGYSESQIAKGLGYTPSAVAQLIDKYELRDKVAKKVVKADSVFDKIDKNLNETELWVAKKVKTAITEVEDPMKLVAILKSINGLKRRGNSEGAKGDKGQVVVPIVLPIHVVERLTREVPADFAYNDRNEAVGIGDRALITADRKSLSNLAIARTERLAEEVLVEKARVETERNLIAERQEAQNANQRNSQTQRVEANADSLGHNPSQTCGTEGSSNEVVHGNKNLHSSVGIAWTEAQLAEALG